MLIFAPKGGATIAAQMWFRYEGVYEKADAYSKVGEIKFHKYRLHVYNRQPAHAPLPCAKACAAGWTCIRLVRQPLDRVVSSYQFGLKNLGAMAATWKELMVLKTGDETRNSTSSLSSSTLNPRIVKILAGTTFEEFISALTTRAQTKTVSSADDHFMPQLSNWRDDEKCDSGTVGPSIRKDGTPLVYYLPTECLDDPEAMLYLGRTTGVVLNATGLTSAHYNRGKVSASYDGLHVASWPWERVMAKHPPYELFTSENASIGRRVCCLFRDDVDMYRRACQQAWLQNTTTCAAECSSQLARLSHVCDIV
uniref:Sulfotransferase domain-containing protein n=1 Tax=Octactis speculum TaxID=3111310 RepID=A0A7S2BRH7_9STRA